MVKRYCVQGLLLSLVVCALGAPSFAQTSKAGVVGSVKDPSGAAVPSAQIKVINVATGQSFSTTTAGDGTYTVPSILDPGNYEVQASHAGFKTATTEAFTLQIGDIRKVDLTLQLGAVTQKVTVSGAPPALQTQTSDVGAVVTGRQIVDLPLNGQNFTGLAVLQPGVTRSYVGVLTDATAFNNGNPNAGSPPGGSNPQGSTEASRFSRSGGASISVNGLRPTNNDFLLDGVDNNEPQFGTIGVFPNREAIQEFKIDTSVPQAQYGRGGALINQTYKSGTNSLHGELYYFGENNALDASHWVLNKDGLPKSVTRVNEFGGTVGGPVMLPGYNGKDRTFFFFDYLGQRNRFPNPFQSTVPTAGSRNGDFSDFSTPIVDPLSCNTPGDTSSGGCKTFVQETGSNAIPNLQSRPDFSPQAFKVLNDYPMPTNPGVRDPSQGNWNYFGVRQNQERINSYDIKIDEQFTQKNRLTGRFTHDNQQRVRANFFPGLPTAGFGAGQEIGNTRQVALDDSHIFSPTVLNDAKFGWTQVAIGIDNCGVEGACGSPADWCTTMGIPNCNMGTPATTGGLGLGGFGTGFTEWLGDGGLFNVRSNNYYIADNVTIIHSNHTFQTGVELRPTYLDPIDGGRAGGLKGQLEYGAGAGGGDIGNTQADMLLSRPALIATGAIIEGGDIPLHLRKTEWALYIQDDWKFRPNLTFNLGLRYEVFPGFHERDGRLANFDVATSSILTPHGSGDSLLNTRYNNFGPRVGFAYNFGPSKQFVLRGGYGLFYTEDGVDFPPLGRNPPVISSVQFSAFSGNQGDFNLTTGPPLAPVQNPPVLSSASVLYTVPKDQPVASINEWNLGVQWQFAQSYLFDVGYVASRGRHLLATRDLGSSANGLGLAVDPAGDHLGTDVLYDNRASSDYDSLQASLRKNFGHGLEFLTSYTWGHGIDDSTGVFNGIGETRGQSGGPIDPFNFRLDRGNSSLDRRQVFVTSGIWDLPFGRGKPIWGNVSGPVDKVIGGWEFNFIQTIESGQHFDVDANTNVGSSRADIIGAPYTGNIDEYLNPFAFQPAALTLTNLAGNKFSVGDMARNALTGPAFYRTDFSVFKNTAITEKVSTQIQFQFSNLWNTVSRIVPNNNISNGGFGVFDNAFPPRTIQYALKIIF